MGTQVVTIHESTASAIVFCTVDGTQPDLASTQHADGDTVSFAATGTLNCMAAIPGVNRKDAETTSPSAPGTFWKPVDCVDAGASGVPTSPIYRNGQSPSISGNGSMEFGFTAQATNVSTNCLWSVHGSAGSCPNCTHFMNDFYEQLGTTNMYVVETDLFDFNNTVNPPPTGSRNMFGTQFCGVGGATGCNAVNHPVHGAGYDLVGNNNVSWTYSGVSGPGPVVGSWLHYQMLTHWIPAELNTKPCKDKNGTFWACLYYDTLILNGNRNPLNQKYADNALPATWLNVTFGQWQLNSKNSSGPSTLYVDKINFLATYDPSSTTSATYTINSSTLPPITLFGNGTWFGHQVQQ